MLALFLLLVIVAIVLGIVGVVAKGLLYLLIIGIVVFLGALLLGALRMRRRPGKSRARLSLTELGFLRGLLNAYAFGTMRMMADIGAIAAFIADAAMPCM